MLHCCRELIFELPSTVHTTSFDTPEIRMRDTPLPAAARARPPINSIIAVLPAVMVSRLQLRRNAPVGSWSRLHRRSIVALYLSCHCHLNFVTSPSSRLPRLSLLQARQRLLISTCDRHAEVGFPRSWKTLGVGMTPPKRGHELLWWELGWEGWRRRLASAKPAAGVYKLSVAFQPDSKRVCLLYQAQRSEFGCQRGDHPNSKSKVQQ